MRGDTTTGATTANTGSDAPVPPRSQHPHRARRRPATIALWVIALALVAIAVMVGVKLFLPGGSQPVLVQFSDLSGRVQLEYCPSLPASFEAIAYTDDLVADTGVIPVKVTGEVCGSTQFDDGIWIYLHRSAVTLASTTPR
ncbi:MAG TPA: hypothetical protein VEX88_08845 [Glaciibacter sp.]|nr:hypothetical protein [Glaciibacter sp.]